MFIDLELCTFFLVGGIFYHYVIFLVLQSTLSIIMCVSVCMLVIILLDVFWDLGIVVTILINFGKFSITLLSLQIFLLHYLCCLLQFWYFPKFLDAPFFFLMFYSLFLCGQFLLRCIFKVIISLALWNLLMSLLMWFFIFVSICFFLIIFVSFYHMFFIFLLELPTCSCILSIFQLDLLTY